MNDAKGMGPVEAALDEAGPARAETVQGRPGQAKPGQVKPGDDAGLDRPTQGRIGDQLRALYDDLLNQPVPDRFVDLLKKLDGNGSA